MNIVPIIIGIVVTFFIGCSDNYEMKEVAGRFYRLNTRTGDIDVVTGNSLVRLQTNKNLTNQENKVTDEEIIARYANKSAPANQASGRQIMGAPVTVGTTPAQPTNAIVTGTNGQQIDLSKFLKYAQPTNAIVTGTNGQQIDLSKFLKYAQPTNAIVTGTNGHDSGAMVDAGGANNHRLKVAPGRIGSVLWSPDGKNVQYLNFPADAAQLHAIREFSPDAAADRLVAKTSQFACFGANRDSSVFVGASANRSSPTVLLLPSVTRREFTLCEHTKPPTRKT